MSVSDFILRGQIDAKLRTDPIHTVGEKIDLLKKAVEQREADLAQEKETNSLLLKQNASMANTFERLKGLEDSLRGVSDKVSEVAAQHTQPDDVVTRETHAK